MDFFWDPFILVLTVSFLASLTVYYRLDPVNSFLKYFPPFLLATILVEFVGTYLQTTRRTNVLLYNFFTSFEFCFYLWIVSLIINNRTVKKTIYVVMVIYFLTATINILFIQKKVFHTVTLCLNYLRMTV